MRKKGSKDITLPKLPWENTTRGGLKQEAVISSQVWRRESKLGCQQLPFLLTCLSGLRVASVLLCSPMALFCVHEREWKLRTWSFSPHNDNNPIGLGPHPRTSFHLHVFVLLGKTKIRGTNGQRVWLQVSPLGGFSGGKELFWILIMVMITQLYTFVTNYKTI